MYVFFACLCIFLIVCAFGPNQLRLVTPALGRRSSHLSGGAQPVGVSVTGDKNCEEERVLRLQFSTVYSGPTRAPQGDAISALNSLSAGTHIHKPCLPKVKG